MLTCQVCGVVDEYYDENSDVHHNDTPKHQANMILLHYKNNKKYFSKNRDGVIVLGSAEASSNKVPETDHVKIIIYVKPKQIVKFSFKISNDMKNEDLLVVGIHLAHPQPQFVMNDHPFIFGGDPHILSKKSTLNQEVSVEFHAQDIGQYEMPIMLTFYRRSDEKHIILIREMVVIVQEHEVQHTSKKSPYLNEDWQNADHFIQSITHVPYQIKFKIPKLLKVLLPKGLDEKALEGLQMPADVMEKLRLLLISTRAIFDEGATKNNYMIYFHHLLWWEEIISKINLRKYNMFGVKIENRPEGFFLEVPGLAEKRPSLLRGDRVYIRPQDNQTIVFESIIKDINDTHVQLYKMDQAFFNNYYSCDSLYDIRFLMSRVPLERMHEAVSTVFKSKQESRIFPQPVAKKVYLKPVTEFYNPLIERNQEQRSAVEHIVSGTSGKAPYIVFGPPGTGKTMTIVEAIVQLVAKNSKNRVMVCTDSNMAADHIAMMLLQYNKKLNMPNFLLRGNSQSREWTVMPSALAPVSNGTSFETFYSLKNTHVSMYRIFVTTLLHAAKYGSQRSQSEYKLQMTHLFIDEAAQASEPATLVPVTGLLSPKGSLILAGDPQQLGPVCISAEAKSRGLGTSLLERLKNTYENLYEDPDYITMLVQNFRSDPDILAIPNEFFYDNSLKPLAPLDPLSRVSVLGLPGGERALVFHAVNSREQRMGNAPSYFNEKELDMLKRYIKALIEKHNVASKDIGVIAPYIRQVYKMKVWLANEKYTDIEVGTVESFQGKEKRVILVSTVRANCRLLDYDAKYGLGFLVDDKRYNVTLTRAKAKLIIIGNPACLTRDRKWRRYMEFARELNCYYGAETQQLERTAELLHEVTKKRFDKCRLSDYIIPKSTNTPKKQSKSKKK
ncbi:putative helicase MOV-10 [Bicyclus anynana]|uniref:RNA helicase n=1 Tax=Bicyclus anynana TaxID=110368 RepID=A0A6J1PAQ6_BICAN|nr:putative helicase MOV-10 [Bicyclus anynana]XP_052743974.1 putative helicase MOV-10 [Bicyclus anynana]